MNWFGWMEQQERKKIRIEREEDKVLSGTCEKKTQRTHNDLSHLAKCFYVHPMNAG